MRKKNKQIEDVSRYIDRKVERELWGRAAGRCQFEGHNQLLYKSPVTQEPVNLAEQAHIYSFSEDGPRGWGPFRKKRSKLNSLENLLLVCQACHKLIDDDKKGVKYSAALLKQWKNDHEKKVRITTGVIPNKTSHVLLYGSKVGDTLIQPQFNEAALALFPSWFPADERAVDLSLKYEHDDSSPTFWGTEAQHLRSIFERQVVALLNHNPGSHFSLFAFASQPLLIFLGSLFTDKIPVEVYQLHREPKTWNWQEQGEDNVYRIIPPSDFAGPPALIISLSAKISQDRIASVLPGPNSIWELTIDNCHSSCLRTRSSLSAFRTAMRKLMVQIAQAHGQSTPLAIFPAMPIACAVELGRIRMPKAEMPWIIFDQNNKLKSFVKAITIGE